MSPRSKLSSYVGKVYISHNDHRIPSQSQDRRSSSFSEYPQPSASEYSQHGFDNSKSYKGKSSGYDSSSKASHGRVQRSRSSTSLLKPTSRFSTLNRMPSTDARVNRSKSYSDLFQVMSRVSHREPSPSPERLPAHKNSGSGSTSSSADWDFADKERKRKLKRKAKYAKRKAPQKEKSAPAPHRNRERPAPGKFGSTKGVGAKRNR